jgi:hypothetical protein
MALAQTLADDGEETNDQGQIVEGKAHEDRQEGKMDAILALVTDIKAKLDALLGEEQKEQGSGDVGVEAAQERAEYGA